MPRISLIICSYNRADILPRCLVAATSQTLPGGEYEVIVVDNASSDHTPSIALRFAGVRYLYCSTRGLSAARNTGVAAARSAVVAFIDDDAIAAPDLLQQIMHVFEDHPRTGCAGGRIQLTLPPRLPSWFAKEFAGYYSEFDPGGAEPRRITEMAEYPFGANIAFRREAIERAGYFSERMGRVGRNQSGGEELELQYRIVQLGYEIFYNPRARVEHVILPQRLRWAHIANSARAAGRNWAYYEIELWKRPIELRPDCRMLLGACIRVLRRERFAVAYSQMLFYRAKILRKLRYLVSPGGAPAARLANH